MKILICRSAAQSATTAGRLAGLGHEAEILPLVEIASLTAPIPRDPYHGVVFTSAHAPPLLAERIKAGEVDRLSFDIAVWCVGEATARAARAAGFRKVNAGPGDARQLAQWLARRLPADARLLYPSARHVAFDLQALLPPVDVRRVQIYEAMLTDTGEAVLATALTRCDGGAALLYSERTSAFFVELVKKYGLGSMLARLTLVAISEKTAGTVRGLSGTKVIVADNPREDSMLDLLAQL